MKHDPSRRAFLSTAAGAALAASSLSPVAGALVAAAPNQGAVRLRKAVKFDMIKHDGSIEDKLNLIKLLGFEGVEINSPSGVNRAEAVAASRKTGIVIHGVIDSVHWNQRLSDPSPDVRA